MFVNIFYAPLSSKIACDRIYCRFWQIDQGAMKKISYSCFSGPFIWEL